MSDSKSTPIAPAAGGEQNPLAAGCPVAHTKGGPNPHPMKTCPVAGTPAHGARAEPTASNQTHSSANAVKTKQSFQYSLQPVSGSGLPADGEVVPENSIPAAGRGNSDDGKSWLNPSANQLFRALARKEKPIEAADANSVAAVHVAVTDNTWSGIMEYEKLHAKSCPNPTLGRFVGMDGIWSYKARMMTFLTGMKPFDRHDWYVNRCGKEVKYVIDYYSIETPDPHTGETAIDYFIDARPAPTISGLYDRARVAFAKWKRGEKIW